ncbi:hypothetical protein SLS54_003047 [Diplodia seriata]
MEEGMARSAQELQESSQALGNLDSLEERTSSRTLGIYNAAIFKITTGQNYTVHFVNASDVSMLSELISSTMELTNKSWISQYDTPYVSEVGDLYLVADIIGLSLKYLPEDSGSQKVCLHVNPVKNWTEVELGKFTSARPGTDMFIGYPSAEAGFKDCNGSEFLWPTMPVNPAGGLGITKYMRYENNSWVTPSPPSTSIDQMPSFRVLYGLAAPRSTGSRFQISLSFMITVICCNVLKLAAISWTLRRPLSSQIMTVGDCIVSFLESPDPVTAGFCTLDRKAAINEGDVAETHQPREIRFIDMLWGKHYSSRFIL